MIAAAGALGLAASASAMGVWAPAQRASTSSADAHSPDVALNGAGAGVAAWVQEVAGRGTIVASARRPDGVWSRPRRLSPPGLSAIDPRIAIDATGRAVAVWRQVARTRVVRGERQAVYLARARERRPGGGWGPVATLSDDRQKIGTPELAIDGRGVAVATWHWGTGTRAGTAGHVGEVQVAEKRSGRPWGPARRASSPGGCRLDTRLPNVATGVGGHAVVWWQCDVAGGRSVTDAIGRGPSPRAWRAERRLPFAASGDQLADLAVEPSGAVVALSAGARGVLAAWRGAGPLGTPAALDLMRVALPAPQGVIRSAGRPSVAAWQAGAVGGWIGPGGLGLADIGSPVRLSARGGPLSPRRDARVAAAQGGSAVAVALYGAGVLVATSRTAGGDWAALERISPGAVTNAAVAATDGVATAYWSRRSGGGSVIERAELRSSL
jgi:hypothetical protein